MCNFLQFKNEKLARQEIMGFLERRYGKDKDFYPSSEYMSLWALIRERKIIGKKLMTKVYTDEGIRRAYGARK